MKSIAPVGLVSLTLCVLLLGGAGDVSAQVPAHKLPTDRNTLPQFTGVTLEGDSVQSSDYESEILIINFWAVWCGPCINELPHVQNLHDQYRKNENVQVTTIYLKNTIGGMEIKEVKKWVNKRNFTFPVVFDKDSSIKRSFGFNGIPLNLLVGENRYLFEIDSTPINTFEKRVNARVSKRLSTEGSSEEEK